MVATKTSGSQQIRARLDHPVIDSDGHTLELTPVLLDYVRQAGGSRMAERFAHGFQGTSRPDWYRMSNQERKAGLLTATAWWAAPSKNTLDRATASLPKLLHQRMDELGIDFAVIYPSWRPGLMRFEDEQDGEMRRVACRALNAYLADMYRDYSDRLTPAAMIPMHTPQEAIEELTYVVQKLGLKVAIIAGTVRRPIDGVRRESDGPASGVYRLDTLGIDSDYDYDHFWAKCVELKVAPAYHGSVFEWEGHGSTSNYVYNHIGAFAKASEAFCKSLFMGGVTRRFPSLRIAFLEGGVGWACSIYSNMIGHWEKRNGRAIWDLDPRNLDQKLMRQLFRKYGGTLAGMKPDETGDIYTRAGLAPQEVDDWSLVPMETVEDIRDLFVEPFYFGCEADDPTNAWAFNSRVNPLGARLKALFGSDIGHWDVPDMREVVAEAYELVEHQLITEADFRDFTFTNSVTFYGGMNPDFFKGTKVEAEASKLLKSKKR